MIQAFYRGNVADKMMRTWLQDPVTGGMVGLVGDAMEVCEQAHQQEGRSVRWRSAAQRGAVREECVQLAGRLEPLLTELVLPHRWRCPYRFEVSVDIETRPVLLVGEIDLFVQTQTGYCIYDLKMTSNANYWRSTVGQLVFYDIAMSVKHGTRAEKLALIQPMCETPVEWFRIGDQEHREMWSHIVNLL
jgi:hypothetical protein